MLNQQEIEAQEIFDGVMLGDGNLIRYRKNASFHIMLSKVLKDGRITMNDNLMWLHYINDMSLTPLDIDVSELYPQYRMTRRSVGQHKGKLCQIVELHSLRSSWLAEQYDRWYSWTGKWTGRKHNQYRKDDTKNIPPDFALTPVRLANWFKGDGESCRSSNHNDTTGLGLSTDCYTEEEVYYLMGMLYDIGIVTIKPGRRNGVIKGSGLSIRVAQRSVNYFFDLVEPNMISHRGMLLYKKKTYENIPLSITCSYCGKAWYPRVLHPPVCSHCKSRHWKLSEFDTLRNILRLSSQNARAIVSTT